MKLRKYNVFNFRTHKNLPISQKIVYLCSDDSVYTIATALAMAQEPVCVCANLLQQQPVEVEIVLAYVDCICLILPYLELDLLF